METGEGAFVSRCSFSPSYQKVTCNKYKIDRVTRDENVNIVKFYHFASQFDVQLWPTLFFVENNGRGGVAYGKCIFVTP